MSRFEVLVDCRKERGAHRSCSGLGLKNVNKKIEKRKKVIKNLLTSTNNSPNACLANVDLPKSS